MDMLVPRTRTYHARKPQPEDEFHKVIPGLSPTSRILRTVAGSSSCGVNLLDKPDGLLSPWCMKSSKRPRILKVTQPNFIIFLHRTWDFKLAIINFRFL